MAKRKKNKWTKPKKCGQTPKGPRSFDPFDRDRKSDEYIEAMKIDVPDISEVKVGPSLEADQDVLVFSDRYEGQNEDPNHLQVQDTMNPVSLETRRINEEDIAQFKISCPGLSESHAFALLSAMSLDEAIEEGNQMKRIKKGYVPKWIFEEVEDPRDDRLKRKKRKERRVVCDLKMDRPRDMRMVKINWNLKKKKAKKQSKKSFMKTTKMFKKNGTRQGQAKD